MASRIEDYALIGDCRTAALVGRDGSIDWFCAPRFDSPASFAALLGTPEHGHFSIAPAAQPVRVSRRYRGETLVLETLFATAEGEVALIDCMPLSADAPFPQIVRVVEGRKGRVAMRVSLVVAFDYGSVAPWVTELPGGIRAVAGPDTLLLHAEVPLQAQPSGCTAEFEIEAGERIPFVLTHYPSHCAPPPPSAAEHLVERTEAAWQAWSSRSQYRGDYRPSVQRSLLTLKALTYEPTGGIVAAPTTSLPEWLGSNRNWDYRLCWLRDATVTLYALLLAGYTEEAQAWREWLLRAVAGTPGQVQVMYGLAGERRLTELELPWLPGFADSRPVRIGNAAHTQLQLDVFGELMDAMHQCRHAELDTAASWALERQLLEFLESHWQQPDAGIWEVRGPLRHFTYSKLMAWVAFDRAVQAVEQSGREGPVERWRAVREQIRSEICARGFSRERNAFVQAYDSEALDASLLQLPLVGFLPADDPRVRSTLAAIERELVIDGTFVLRYRTHRELDGLPEGEGAFLACSFWLVSNLVMQGRRDEARALFERLEAVQNEVGLFAEEYDPRSGRQLGNYPQAFTHLALVDAAEALSGLGDPSRHRCQPRHAGRDVGRNVPAT